MRLTLRGALRQLAVGGGGGLRLPLARLNGRQVAAEAPSKGLVRRNLWRSLHVRRRAASAPPLLRGVRPRPSKRHTHRHAGRPPARERQEARRAAPECSKKQT